MVLEKGGRRRRWERVRSGRYMGRVGVLGFSILSSKETLRGNRLYGVHFLQSYVTLRGSSFFKERFSSKDFLPLRFILR